MDDQRRAAERAASAGDETARTQWILSQLRAGALGSDRVWLAARLGDVAARQALQSAVAPLPGACQARFARPLDRAARRALSDLDAPWGDVSGSVLGPQGEVQVWCQNDDAVLIGFDAQGERGPETA